MSDQLPHKLSEVEILSRLQALEPTRRNRIIQKIVSAALGSIPWVGGFMAATLALKTEAGQLEVNDLTREWLREHQILLQKLFTELGGFVTRLETLGEDISERLESEEYLALVRKAFRTWDQADTDLKRDYIVRLLANAGATKLSDDDIVRLFLEWLERYHEAHFKVIREVYKNPGCTRYSIWKEIHGTFPAENSAEADLFRLLVDDLSQGRIIRQHREVNFQGDFLRNPKAPKGSSGGTLTSSFDDKKEYELTALGRQFVHYVFTDVVIRLGIA